MRMWNVDPKIMCANHILGEHVELHMFVGSILVGKSLKGYVENNLVEPKHIQGRHKELVEEMKNRRFSHNSDLPDFNLNNLPIEIKNAKVDSQKSLKELLSRCNNCRKRFNNFKK